MSDHFGQMLFGWSSKMTGSFKILAKALTEVTTSDSTEIRSMSNDELAVKQK